MAFNTAEGRAVYTASSAQTEFTFTFKVFTTSDIKVYQTPSGDTPNDTTDLLTLTTDYTVTINGDNGGTITLVSGATTGDTITLVRDLGVKRDVDYQDNGDLLASTLDADQNYQTYLILDGYTKLSRAVNIPESLESVSTVLPSPTSNSYIKWNSTADALENDTQLNDALDNIADISTVANDISSVVTTATNISNVNTVATNISNVNATATYIANVNAVGSDLLEPTSEINTVATNITAVDTVSGWIDDGFPSIISADCVIVDTIAELTAIPSGYTTAIVKDLNRGGTFIWSSTGTANGGTVFAGATGYWNRQYSGAVNVKWFGAVGDGITNDTVVFKGLLSIENSIIEMSGNYLIKEPVVVGKNTKIIGDNCNLVLDFSGGNGLTLKYGSKISGVKLLPTSIFNKCALVVDNFEIYQGVTDSFSTGISVENVEIKLNDIPTLQNLELCGISLESYVSLNSGGSSGFYGCNFHNMKIVNFPTAIRIITDGTNWVNSNSFNYIYIESPINAFYSYGITDLNTIKNMIIQTSSFTKDIIIDSGRNTIIDYITWDTYRGVDATDSGVQQGDSEFSSGNYASKKLFTIPAYFENGKYVKIGSFAVSGNRRTLLSRFRVSNAYAYADFNLYFTGASWSLKKTIYDTTGYSFETSFRIFTRLVRGIYVIYMFNNTGTSTSNNYNITFFDNGSLLPDSAIGGVALATLSSGTEATTTVEYSYSFSKRNEIFAPSITFESGFTSGGNTYAIKAHGRVVTIIATIYYSSGFTVSTNTLVGNIPIGYRPTSSINFSCGLSVADYSVTNVGYAYIGTNGNIQIASPIASMKYAHISISYIV